MLLKLLQARPTLCDPMDSSPQGSSVLGILQERILEWFAISYYIKLKGFCTVKETIDKRKKKKKRQPTEWERIFANERDNQGLMSNIYKISYNLTSKKKKRF